MPKSGSPTARSCRLTGSTTTSDRSDHGGDHHRAPIKFRARVSHLLTRSSPSETVPVGDVRGRDGLIRAEVPKWPLLKAGRRGDNAHAVPVRDGGHDGRRPPSPVRPVLDELPIIDMVPVLFGPKERRSSLFEPLPAAGGTGDRLRADPDHHQGPMPLNHTSATGGALSGRVSPRPVRRTPASSSLYHPMLAMGCGQRPFISLNALSCAASPAATTSFRWRSCAFMTSSAVWPWCSRSQGPPNCLPGHRLHRSRSRLTPVECGTGLPDGSRERGVRHAPVLLGRLL